jgi:hypothetical protein
MGLLQVGDVDWDLALAKFRTNGFVVFDNVLAPAAVDAMHASFARLLDTLRARDGGATLERDMRGMLVPVGLPAGEHGDIRTGHGRLQQVHRYTCNVPWVRPFADPTVYEHPVILEFLERYWGDADFRITCYHSNTPDPGSQHQHWHRDANTSQNDGGTVVPQSCPHFGVKIPLVDTCEENGSFEARPQIAPSHRPHRASYDAECSAVQSRGGSLQPTIISAWEMTAQTILPLALRLCFDRSCRPRSCSPIRRAATRAGTRSSTVAAPRARRSAPTSRTRGGSTSRRAASGCRTRARSTAAHQTRPARRGPSS